MNAEQFSSALGKVNDKYIMEAITYERKKKSGWLKWGAIAACFGLILTVASTTLPGILRGQNQVELPPDPGLVPGVSDNEHQDNDEPLQPPRKREITIDWDNVAVNESAGLAPDHSRLYPDPALYNEEILDMQGVKTYYGWELAPAYIPDDLTGGGKAVSGRIVREKATGNVVEDQAGRSFWVDFGEDGRPKSNDDIEIPKGFTIRASRLRILHCCLLPVDEERTTDFGGVPVTLSHAALTYGDGISNVPAGYYDVYVASFTLDGVEYEIEAQRLELEEVIKIAASIIDPFSKNFAVGGSQSVPDKGSAPTEYPDTIIVPGFDLDEPSEPDTP